MTRMWERVEIARQDSDTAQFLHLLYSGEMLTKLVAASLVAAIADDRERHRYRLLHRLVRADGLGEWVQALDQILIGPASQHLNPDARDAQQQLTQKLGPGQWQNEAFGRLHAVLKTFVPETENAPFKVSGQQCFQNFVLLRNRTRGHGAPSPAVCSGACPDLEFAIRLISDNLLLLQKPWAYLHRNLSGKYRVIGLGGDTSCFEYLKRADYLKTSPHENLPDGVYIHFNHPVRVPLISTNIDVADFFLANGSFKGRSFESISYL